MNKVQGKDHLIRTDTGAIINADQPSYEMAKAHKRRLLQEREKQRSLEQRIDKLEHAITKLLGDRASEDKQ